MARSAAPAATNLWFLGAAKALMSTYLLGQFPLRIVLDCSLLFFFPNHPELLVHVHPSNICNKAEREGQSQQFAFTHLKYLHHFAEKLVKTF